VGILLLSFWKPLQETANLIPSIIDRSDAITLSGLSIKIGERLHNKASPEVQDVLAKLSKRGIEKLLTTPSNGTSSWQQASYGRSDSAELLKLGLVAEVMRDEYGYSVEITDLGQQTQDFLKSLIAQFVEELTSKQPAGQNRSTPVAQ
jgi:hypothetical protein